MANLKKGFYMIYELGVPLNNTQFIPIEIARMDETKIKAEKCQLSSLVLSIIFGIPTVICGIGTLACATSKDISECSNYGDGLILASSLMTLSCLSACIANRVKNYYHNTLNQINSDPS